MDETTELSPIDPVTGVDGEPLDYHIVAGAAINAGDSANALVIDFDNDTWPQYGGFDIITDEVVLVP